MQGPFLGGPASYSGQSGRLFWPVLAIAVLVPVAVGGWDVLRASSVSSSVPIEAEGHVVEAVEAASLPFVPLDALEPQEVLGAPWSPAPEPMAEMDAAEPLPRFDPPPQAPAYAPPAQTPPVFSARGWLMPPPDPADIARRHFRKS